MPSSSGQRFHTIAVIVALAAAASIVAFLVLRPGVVAGRPPGVVQPTEIKIAPETSGRLLRFAVTRGQSVRKGDTLAELSNPELEAGLVLAQAQLGQARAARDRVYAGPRQEQVDALAQDIDMANANLVYAHQQFSRTSQLAATGFASHQDLDKATAAVETGNANLSRAKERYEAARLGPTREERAIADAGVNVAAAAVAVVAARVAKLRIRAPSNGVVALLVAEPSEAIVPGQPVMTLQMPGQRWASFNLREDQLGNLRVGARVELTPPKGVASVDARIDEIIPRGEFATWRAARVVGDHDLNTFLVRADPVEAAASGLQPGMSVWLGRPTDPERQ
ncbi:MAG: HlyD family secretion protein [Stellaceae bacterium]|jgi:HlyD family secretion protein